MNTSDVEISVLKENRLVLYPFVRYNEIMRKYIILFVRDDERIFAAAAGMRRQKTPEGAAEYEL